MKQHDEKLELLDEDSTSITQTLRILNDRTTGAMEPESAQQGRYRALLVCNDRSAERWGTRWFGQSNFDVVTTSDRKQALAYIESDAPDVLVVEAALAGTRGKKLYQEIQDSAQGRFPVFVICNSTQETSAALDADVFDVVRKPVDWQILCRRARNTVAQHQRERELEQTRESLKSALQLANRARKELRRTEAFEPVTGLPNRTKFIDLVNRGITAARRDGNHLVVFVVVFRRSRMILEALGRNDANVVITEIAQRLNNCVRVTLDASSDLNGLKTAAIANIGVGKFAVMLTSSPNGQEARALCHEITEQLTAPTVVGGQTIYLSTTAGAANFPDVAEDAEVLLIKAEAAMREAHAKGLAFQRFDANIGAAAARRLKIEQQLHQALDNRELRLAYQPINDVMTDRLVAVEALLRWPRRDGEVIGPAEFVPIAEDAGLINEIGTFVIEEACRQLRAWRDAGLSDVRVAINVARRQLLDPELPRILAQALQEYGVAPRQLEVEISERGVLTGNEEVIRQLFQLKSLGISISVDDFGTGESSLAYLKDMPIDTLKIDRSYIAKIARDGRESRMIAAMVALAQKLELTVIAEGVEIESQLNILQSLGCDFYQGFLRSAAMWPDEVVRFAASSRT